MPANISMVFECPRDRHSSLGGDWAATGVRWKCFLVARAAAPRREAVSPDGMLARQWRANQWLPVR